MTRGRWLPLPCSTRNSLRRFFFFRAQFTSGAGVSWHEKSMVFGYGPRVEIPCASYALISLIGLMFVTWQDSETSGSYQIYSIHSILWFQLAASAASMSRFVGCSFSVETCASYTHLWHHSFRFLSMSIVDCWWLILIPLSCCGKTYEITWNHHMVELTSSIPAIT